MDKSVNKMVMCCVSDCENDVLKDTDCCKKHTHMVWWLINNKWDNQTMISPNCACCGCDNHKKTKKANTIIRLLTAITDKDEREEFLSKQILFHDLNDEMMRNIFYIATVDVNLEKYMERIEEAVEKEEMDEETYLFLCDFAKISYDVKNYSEGGSSV